MHVLIARRGRPEILETPDPVPAGHEVLIRTAWSAISPGTELEALTQQSSSLLSLAKKGVHKWDKVRKSLKTRGLRQTLAKVEATLETPIPLGYSLSGEVIGVGADVKEFRSGDWVVAVGPGAHHGTLACVPRLFCAKLPGPALARDSACAALTCVGLHAFRRAELAKDSRVAVFGLGVIGQFMVQVLRAAGHAVTAFDPVESRRSDAASCGATMEDPAGFDFEAAARRSGQGDGVDAVFLCAKTASSVLLRQASALCRRRARLIVVGEFPIELPRDAAYEKELEVRLSAAYGEGRYDPAYERFDEDYPEAEGRWTVRHNLELFVRWLGEGKLVPASLHPECGEFSRAREIYANLPASPSVLNLLEYPDRLAPRPVLEISQTSREGLGISLAVVGTGRFAAETHLPNLRQAAGRFHLDWLVGHTPARVTMLGRKFGIRHLTCSLKDALKDPGLKAVLIVTPHAQHALQTLAALRAGKHVYVEKPLCLHKSELEEIRRSSSDGQPVLFVGFNRRYAPLSQHLRREITRGIPLRFRYVFRAPPLPVGEWYDRPGQGGRFLGEACHAVDWISWFIGGKVQHHEIKPAKGRGMDIHLEFENDSRAVLQFEPVAELRGPKEEVEILAGENRFHLVDFLRLESMRGSRGKIIEISDSKGHREALEAFASTVIHPGSGQDPHGFLSGMSLILELNEALHPCTV